MKFTPRPFQAVAIDHAVDFLKSADVTSKQLYSAPTGVGKSVVELCVQERMGDDCWIVSPREEIIHGMFDKLGCPGADMFEKRICTPIRLRNALLQGRLRHPTSLIFDEAHHHNAESWQQLDLLTGLCPSVAYTATPYRGTPRSTKEFLERWGEAIPLITYKEAIDEGFITMPKFSVLPLVDDDIVEVKGSDFEVTALESATLDRLGDLAGKCKEWHDGTLWDKATIIALPSSACCRRMCDELARRGMASTVVSAETPKQQRQDAFAATEARVLALLHINVVTEGVDLRLRRLVDAAPTMSPVKWTQQLGRIMRPTVDELPEYVCTNRNVLRHAYILEGVVPSHSVVEAEKSFPPTTRGHARVIGMESLGRFKPATVKLTDGTTAYTYSVSAVVGSGVVEFCCVVPPAKDPVWAMKVNTVKDGVKTWGTWMKCSAPENLVGFGSVAPKPPSEKQAAWWKRSAAGFGLDPDQPLDRKSFVALPVLVGTGERLL